MDTRIKKHPWNQIRIQVSLQKELLVSGVVAKCSIIFHSLFQIQPVQIWVELKRTCLDIQNLLGFSMLLFDAGYIQMHQIWSRPETRLNHKGKRTQDNSARKRKMLSSSNVKQVCHFIFLLTPTSQDDTFLHYLTVYSYL